MYAFTRRDIKDGDEGMKCRALFMGFTQFERGVFIGSRQQKTGVSKNREGSNESWISVGKL